MKKTLLVLATTTLMGCSSLPATDFAFIPPTYLLPPANWDEPPATPHSNQPLQIFFGVEGSAIKLPSDRASTARNVNGQIILE